MAGHVFPDHNLPPGGGLLARLHIDRRRALALAAGGALLIGLLILNRSRGEQSKGVQPADNTTTAADGSSTPGTPSTFADNGGQAAQLGNDVTSSLGQVGLGLQSVQDSIDQLTAQQAAIAPAGDTLGAAATPPVVVNVSAATPQVAAKGAPAGRVPPVGGRRPAKPAPTRRTPAKTAKTKPAKKPKPKPKPPSKPTMHMGPKVLVHSATRATRRR